MTALRREHLSGDLWGGLASSLVALPASIAFGVAIFSPLGTAAAAQGAMAGMLGAVAMGIVAPLCGGTDRLISAPCAPAAAVLGAFALEALQGSPSPERLLALMTVVALLSGLLQIVYGAVGGGTLIKYIPYPVVTGYLSGVGVVILLKQLPAFLGLPKGGDLWEGVTTPAVWRWPGVVVGVVTILVMLLAPRLTRAVPAAILGLMAGLIAYYVLGFFQPGMRVLEGNPLVIGELGVGGSPVQALAARRAGLLALRLADIAPLLIPALTLSVLLSIDTLKTCVVVDSLTRSRHDSNREIRGQGLANLVSAVIGGVPGAGTSGATLVNLASGGRTRLSSVLEGVFSLLAVFFLGSFVAWAPIAALAGILMVVGFRMLDRSSLRLLRSRSTVLDFAVIAIVVVVAVTVDLISASGVGVALAIVLFIRDQVHSSVIRRRAFGNQAFSRQRRLAEEMEVLERKGAGTLICELQGNLFFGTADQLRAQLSADLATCRLLILDLRLVRSVDFTAAHVLEQIHEQLKERGAELVFSGVPERLPSGQHLLQYLEEVGLVKGVRDVRVFQELSDALEWAEDRLLAEAGRERRDDLPPLSLREIDFLKGRKEETVRELERCVEERHYEPGERLFSQGDPADAIYFVRRGAVRILMRLAEGREHHLATVARGDFLGEVAFLDQGYRSADAVAASPTEVFVLSRDRFDVVAEEHPRLGRAFFALLARALAMRLRRADAEIRGLEP